MRYKISWTERSGWYTYIIANSEEEALELWYDSEKFSAEPDDFLEREQDSVEIEEDK